MTSECWRISDLDQHQFTNSFRVQGHLVLGIGIDALKGIDLATLWPDSCLTIKIRQPSWYLKSAMLSLE